MDAAEMEFWEGLDDSKPAYRLFLLDRGEIVCSDLLTEREAIRRSHEASKSRCPTVVEEARLVKYRALPPGDPMRDFISDSEFGTNRMFWELLARAKETR